LHEAFTDEYWYVCLSLIGILLDVINGYYSFGLLVQLAINCLQKLLASCSQNLDRTSVSQWHRLCIPTHYFLMLNIPLYYYTLHLSLSYVFDPLLDIDPSFKEF
jgi:hypothetical protein